MLKLNTKLDKKSILLFFVVMWVVGDGLAAIPKQASEQPSKEAVAVAKRSKASFVTEIHFEVGSAHLSLDAQKELKDLLQEAHERGAVNDFKVVAWSDVIYPSAHTRKLSQEEKSLADQRGKEIKQFLRGVDRGVKVETYNMAERPGLFASLLGTPGARIKKSLENQGATSSPASKSIVMVILKD